MTEEAKNEKTLDRRTVLKGAAWSVPVIAAAVATPMAAATTVGQDDLVPSLSGLFNLSLTLGPITVATINTPNTLTISNIGTDPSPEGATVAVQYPSSLLTLNIAGAGITVLGSDGDYQVVLPAIPAGDSLVITLGTTLDSLLNLSILQGLLGGPTPQVTAVVAGDSVTDNNSTASNIGITLL